MLSLIARRLLTAIPVIVIVTMLVFALVQLIPGDPAYTYLGAGGGEGEIMLDEETLQKVRELLGLDQPIPVQYVKWMINLARGDMGTSLVSGQPVFAELRNRIPVTLQIIAFSWMISLAIAFPAGIISALMRNRPPDVFASVTAMAGVALPNFWLGILLIMLFSVKLGWVPPSGHASLLGDPVEAVKLMILPGITLGTGMAASTMRQVRSSMLETLRQDYVRTARAKGLTERTVIFRHVMRNSMLPVLTVMGLQLPFLIGGSVIIESIFGIPGMGQFAVGSIFTRDFLVVQAVVLVAALVTIVANLVTDISYSFIDPRIRYG